MSIDIQLNPNFKTNLDICKLTQSITKTIEKHKEQHIKSRIYTFPSGKIVNYQGYEHLALAELVKTYEESDIENNRQLVPNFKYMFNNKVSYYYPDIFIKSDKLIIEVKSLWTYNLQLVRNILKALAVRQAGYEFEFWIYDKKKNKIII